MRDRRQTPERVRRNRCRYPKEISAANVHVALAVKPQGGSGENIHDERPVREEVERGAAAEYAGPTPMLERPQFSGVDGPVAVSVASVQIGHRIERNAPGETGVLDDYRVSGM
ncbi:MAG: hypothetical protein ACE5HE_00010 [Phycisphaerae bacterium]